MSEDLWQGVLYLHLLAMAFFVGGQLLIAAVVVPTVGREADTTRMRRIARRFGIGSAIALVVLLATGIAMAERFGIWSSDALQAKLMLVTLVLVLVLAHLFVPRSRALQLAIFVTSLAIVWLGLEV